MCFVAGCTPTPASQAFLAIAFTLQGLCLAVVTLRIVSRVVTRAGLSADDALSVVGAVFSLATTVCYNSIGTSSSHQGIGSLDTVVLLTSVAEVIYGGIGYHLDELIQKGWESTGVNLSAVSLNTTTQAEYIGSPGADTHSGMVAWRSTRSATRQPTVSPSTPRK